MTVSLSLNLIKFKIQNFFVELFNAEIKDNALQDLNYKIRKSKKI